MNTMNPVGTSTVEYPIAVRDQDLRLVSALHIEIYEVCSHCGQRFGIGYLQHSSPAVRTPDVDLLPSKLMEILAKDHRHDRQHKPLIELDI